MQKAIHSANSLRMTYCTRGHHVQTEGITASMIPAPSLYSWVLDSQLKRSKLRSKDAPDDVWHLLRWCWLSERLS